MLKQARSETTRKDEPTGRRGEERRGEVLGFSVSVSPVSWVFWSWFSCRCCWFGFTVFGSSWGRDIMEGRRNRDVQTPGLSLMLVCSWVGPFGLLVCCVTLLRSFRGVVIGFDRCDGNMCFCLAVFLVFSSVVGVAGVLGWFSCCCSWLRSLVLGSPWGQTMLDGHGHRATCACLP